MKGLAIDLFCGLGGWTDGLLAEGWDVVGFDCERHAYGDAKYPAQLVLQDVLTLDGAQFRNADLIVASPPCQEFSYMAMPWSKAKAKIGVIEACPTEWLRLCALFDACFRIQREACQASGRHIPLIVENVRGAQRWVGRSRWNFGSFHLWGDVPALMPMTKRQTKNGGGSWFTDGNGATVCRNDPRDEIKTVGHPNIRDGHPHTRHLTNIDEHCDCENPEPESGAALVSMECPVHNWNPRTPPEGVKQGGISGPRANGKGDAWFQDGAARHGSKSNARKAASAMIAKIPFALSSYIGRHFRPEAVAA